MENTAVYRLISLPFLVVNIKLFSMALIRIVLNLLLSHGKIVLKQRDHGLWRAVFKCTNHSSVEIAVS